MKYLMLVTSSETVEVAPADADPTAWVEEMERRGVREQGNRLRPASDATTIRVRDGQTLISDGPFAETTEQIDGFDILDCADLDEAIEIAAKHPAARFGALELRPYWDQ